MKETRILMGMPITIEVVDLGVKKQDIDAIFQYFVYVDETFSTYKSTSEISNINDGVLNIENASQDVKEVFLLCDKTKQESDGYFDIIDSNGKYDPSGLVKGWAIYHGAKLLEKAGFNNFYIEAGGDIQVFGKNGENKPWTVGIKNPFNVTQIVKVVALANGEGIATSGKYERGNHIYNPKNRSQELSNIASVTVVGPNIYEADRFATAAFAMQLDAIYFIERLPGLEGYVIDNQGIATMTSGFQKYV